MADIGPVPESVSSYQIGGTSFSRLIGAVAATLLLEIDHLDRGPPLWEVATTAEQAENDPQWDSSAQPAPEVEFDQPITC